MRDDFPLPDVDWEPLQPFWAGAARGVLAMPRCEGCGRLVWYPAATCRRCGGGEFEWTELSGRARLFAWTVVHHAFLPQFADLVPYIAALVTPDEDPDVRLVTRLLHVDPELLAVDLPLVAVYRPLRFPGITREVPAPLFTTG